MSSLSYNHTTLAGNLTRDVQLRFLANEKSVASFTVASSRRYIVGDDQREDSLFLDCEAWGRTGEVIAKHFTKGKPILVAGRLRQDTWADKETGKNRAKLVLVVSEFAFVPDGRRQGDPAHPAPADTPAPAPTDDEPPF